jgi:hypothetical protein
MVLVCNWGTKERHDPIAGVLIDGSLVAVDALRQDPEETIHDSVPRLWIDLLAESHRADDVDEERGHGLALCFERRARSQDPLGQVARRVVARSARRATRELLAEDETFANLFE